MFPKKINRKGPLPLKTVLLPASDNNRVFSSWSAKSLLSAKWNFKDCCSKVCVYIYIHSVQIFCGVTPTHNLIFMLLSAVTHFYEERCIFKLTLCHSMKVSTSESESLRDGEVKPQAPLFMTFSHEFFAQLSSCEMLCSSCPYLRREIH